MDQQTIFVKILLPQKPFLVKEVKSVLLPAQGGPYLVLPNRAPAMKRLTNGFLILDDADKEDCEQLFITSGIAKMREDACTILTHHALNLDKVDVSSLKKEIEMFETLECKPEEKNLYALTAKKIAFLQQVIGHCEKRN